MTKKDAYQKMAKHVIDGLERRNIEGYYCEDRREALEQALCLMEPKGTVSSGGSQTLKDLGIMEALRERGWEIIEYKEEDRTTGGGPAFLKASGADYFLMSANAVTVNGELVNIDGASNRVSSMLHGPRNVIMIVGINKIVKDVESGINRIQTSVCPVLAAVSGRQTPCSIKGVCTNCLSPDCMCCNIVITRRSRYTGRMKLILVGEELGI